MTGRDFCLWPAFCLRLSAHGGQRLEALASTSLSQEYYGPSPLEAVASLDAPSNAIQVIWQHSFARERTYELQDRFCGRILPDGR
jgi:hypothetical protein